MQYNKRDACYELRYEPLFEGVRKVGITSSSVSGVLSFVGGATGSGSTQILVTVVPPLYVQGVTATKVAGVPEEFMSNWTRLLGDSVVLKWIVFGFAASMALNAYILKGIRESAAFSQACRHGVNFTGQSERLCKDKGMTSVRRTTPTSLKRSQINFVPDRALASNELLTRSDTEKALKTNNGSKSFGYFFGTWISLEEVSIRPTWQTMVFVNLTFEFILNCVYPPLIRRMEQTTDYLRLVQVFFSAILPNCRVVASFLRANEKTALYYFDASDRATK
ncbi:hypothetical protein BD410DRAFT_809373 [Rickenella mellea]|uniref:Uncharacterized protein n=1 Tax=Rickenella mellea TaxID=50990 RepID=A0A4Y7PHF4_9AGAM|nr:hypothetical protein BD410DRAFT_809373 [Rickenella mellea]